MNSVFSEYSKFYNQFYANKKYSDECKKIIELMSQFDGKSEKKKILEIGCGTGNYSKYLYRNSKALLAIDKSTEMINIAKKNNRNFEDSFIDISLTEFLNSNVNNNFDVIILLFHVLTYFTDEELFNLKRIVDSNLNKNGYLIFDYWESEGVVKKPPETTIKEIEINAIEILERVATPSFVSENRVDVRFDFFLVNKNQAKKVKLFDEYHIMYPRSKKYLENYFALGEPLISYDLAENEEYSGKNYGNLLMFKKKN